MAEDKMKGKNYSGTFAGGQGPVLGQNFSNEKEIQGTPGGENSEFISRTSKDGGTDVKPSGEDKHFDLQGKAYAGPENMVPEDKGDVTPSK